MNNKKIIKTFYHYILKINNLSCAFQLIKKNFFIASKKTGYAGLSALLVLGLVACGDPVAEDSTTPETEEGSEAQPWKGYVKQAMSQHSQGSLQEASRLINQAIQRFPNNPRLHLINGLFYEEMSNYGMLEQDMLAEVAYKKAISLNPVHWFGYYLLGKFQMKHKVFGEAQEAFAQATERHGGDPMLWYWLASASYYTQDLPVARIAIEKALALIKNKTLEPDKQAIFHRAASIIFAATHAPELAKKHLEALKSLRKQDEDLLFVEGRVDRWNALYDKKLLHKAAGQRHIDEAATDGLDQEREIEVTQEDLNLINDDLSKEEEETLEQIREAKTIIFDCYFLRVSDAVTTQKGVNIIKGLLSGGGFGVDGGIGSLVINKSRGNRTEWTVTQPLSWGQLQYSLNIMNASDTHIEIMRHPTLTTFLHKKAIFESGKTSQTAVEGAGGGSLLSLPSGIRLEILPYDVEGDFILVDIVLEGSLLSIDETKTLREQTASLLKTEVQTTMELKFGETAVLGGLYERVEEEMNDSFPFFGLHKVPGLQYFFSSLNIESRRESVLLLVTPRHKNELLNEVKTHFKMMYDRQKKPAVKRLASSKTKESKSKAPKDRKLWVEEGMPVMITLLEQMGVMKYEFVTGDILAPFSYSRRLSSLRDDTAQIMSFLYY